VTKMPRFEEYATDRPSGEREKAVTGLSLESG
jgi:hypothetical protein